MNLVYVLIVLILTITLTSLVLHLLTQQREFTSVTYYPCINGCTQDIYDARVAEWKAENPEGRIK